MTKRERVLAIIVACLAPVALLFLVFMWFIGTYNDQGMEIIRLRKEFKNKKTLFDEAQAAKQRREYYQANSFPSDESAAKVASDAWLKNLIVDKAGIKILGDKRLGSSPIRITKDGKTTDVANKISRSVRMSGTLDQWVQFVDEFNRSALLKRLVSFKLTPRTVGGTGKQKLVRTGEVTIEAAFDFLSLENSNAVAGQPLSAAQVPMPRSLEDYRQQISMRNVFSPANNPPVLKVGATTAYAGNEVSFPVNADDADEQDLLEFKLLSTDIEGATLTPQGSADSRSATFKCPPLDVGDYTLVLGVADNGNPSKSDQKEVVLKVAKKANNPPTLARDSRSIEVYAGEPIRANIQAEDRDEDPVSFELLNSELAGALLTQVEGANEAEFVCEALEPGDYEIEVKLDDGKEPKLVDGEPDPTIAKFTLKVLPPKFVVAQQTKITSIVRNKSGGISASINVRPEGVIHEVQVGDSFELDKLTWLVKSISLDRQEVVFEVDGRLKTFKFRDFLSSPRSERPLAESAGEEAAELPALSKTDINNNSSDN